MAIYRSTNNAGIFVHVLDFNERYFIPPALLSVNKRVANAAGELFRTLSMKCKWESVPQLRKRSE